MISRRAVKIRCFPIVECDFLAKQPDLFNVWGRLWRGVGDDASGGRQDITGRREAGETEEGRRHPGTAAGRGGTWRRRYRRETPGRAREREKESRQGGRERGRHRKEGVGTEIDAGAAELSCISLVSAARSLRKRSDARQGCTWNSLISAVLFSPRLDSSFSARRVTTRDGRHRKDDWILLETLPNPRRRIRWIKFNLPGLIGLGTFERGRNLLRKMWSYFQMKSMPEL